MKYKKYKENKILPMMLKGYVFHVLGGELFFKINLKNHKLMACDGANGDYAFWGDISFYMLGMYTCGELCPMSIPEANKMIRELRKRIRGANER